MELHNTYMYGLDVLFHRCARLSSGRYSSLLVSDRERAACGGREPPCDKLGPQTLPPFWPAPAGQQPVLPGTALHTMDSACFKCFKLLAMPLTTQPDRAQRRVTAGSCCRARCGCTAPRRRTSCSCPSTRIWAVG